ncbi:NAD(P)-binding domain-containing protein [Hoylesella shahii]|uniref:NAD(P)-binding domain-containing protein n=1 Tax=Hoylesella shahii TaxID=228603 RepID=UPI001E362E19|nr:NAD(P)-binding domain-containing protein [Hoylesella shahii]
MNDIKQFKVVLLGAGNLATSLGLALVKSGFSVEQVYSRTLEAAQTLANVLNASAVSCSMSFPIRPMCISWR